ncbi:MAG: hypothetical protein AAF725_25785 [Acidobacteriota bacterium]
MKLKRLLTLSLALSMAATSAFGIVPAKPALKTGSLLDQAREQLQSAADERRIAIETREMLTLVREDITLLVASLEGFEQVPATAALDGVDVGFAYIDAPRSDIPTGYYTLRASAQDVAQGRIESQVHLIDDSGRTVGEFPAEMAVRSLEVPDNPEYNRTVVGGEVDADHESGFRRISVWIICPNGWAFCFTVHSFDYWDY